MKVKVISEGCSANFAEGEIIKGIFKRIGHDIIEAVDETSDIIVYNICTVKGDFKKIKNIELFKKKGRVIVTGCISKKITEKYKEDDCVSLISTKNIDRVLEGLAKINILEDKKLIKLGFHRVKANELIGIVPISSGCLDHCSYCSTKHSKGDLQSYSIEEIADEVKKFVKDGCKEIWLTGQDTTCYGFDIGTNIIELLKNILKIEGDYRIRIGMGNIRHIKKYAHEFVKIFEDKKIFKFVHIPLQAGSDKVLKKMNRKHTLKDYLDLVNKFRTQIPKMTISTDIILGHPGETDEDFKKTLDIIKETKPEVINISRYVERPGTIAEKMKDKIHGRDSKKRSRQLTKTFEMIAEEQNKKWIGKKCKIVIMEKGKNNTSVGRNDSYRPIVVKEKYELGTELNVEIIDAKIHHLEGRVI